MMSLANPDLFFFRRYQCIRCSKNARHLSALERLTPIHSNALNRKQRINGLQNPLGNFQKLFNPAFYGWRYRNGSLL